MKPTRNMVFCIDCQRTKILFETEKKAENFIKFNKEEIEEESGFSPQRSYYCLFCEGWHTTSIKEKIGSSKKEQLYKQYKQEKEHKKTTKEIHQKVTTDIRVKHIERQIHDMELPQLESFFSENIAILKEKIDSLVQLNTSAHEEETKELRQQLTAIYIVRKQNGFQKVDKKREEIREKEMDEWRAWAEKIGYKENP